MIFVENSQDFSTTLYIRMIEFDVLFVFLALDQIRDIIEEDGINEMYDIVGMVREILEDGDVDLSVIDDTVIENLINDYGDPLLIGILDEFDEVEQENDDYEENEDEDEDDNEYRKATCAA